jgi:hypothetical protein
MKRIHIVGCGPRSGTTLMAELMIACMNIDAHGVHEDSIHCPPPRGSRIFLTKKPVDILVVEPVLRVCPCLHVIYLLRDPRDMVCSRHGKASDRYWSSLTFWKTYTPHGRRLAGHRRFIAVRYEDLVADPDGVQSQLVERMPFLEKKALFSSFHKMSSPSKDSLDALGGVRPVSVSSVGSWRRHLPRVAGQLRLHGPITEDLIEYGYEKDDSWLGELDGVEPDLSPGHLPEHFHAKALKRVRRFRRLKALGVLFRNCLRRA